MTVRFRILNIQSESVTMQPESALSMPPITERALILDDLAHAIPSSHAMIVGPNLLSIERRFLPRLGKHVLQLEDGPAAGYETEEQARQAASEYRQRCRDQLVAEGFPLSSPN